MTKNLVIKSTGKTVNEQPCMIVNSTGVHVIRPDLIDKWGTVTQQGDIWTIKNWTINGMLRIDDGGKLGWK